MASNPEEMYQLVWWTRRLFQQLRVTSEELMEGTGINASQRAVLEFLYGHPAQTVSHMAREKDLSRQHNQTVVNNLLELGLVEAQDNPAHKRSPLIMLTAEGKKRFQKITRKEAKVLADMAEAFDEQAIATSSDTLKSIHDYLQAGRLNK